MTDRDAESRRRRIDSVIPELIKRAVELGVEKASEAPENVKQFVGDLKLPKEIAHYILGQVEETKNGLFRVVAKEIRDFLEHTNIAGEMQKMLTTVQFEINTTIRFRPNADAAGGRNRESRDSGPLSKPEVKTQVQLKREESPPSRGRRRPRGEAETEESSPESEMEAPPISRPSATPAIPPPSAVPAANTIKSIEDDDEEEP